MDADRWSRIQQLYHEAAALEDAKRVAFLAGVGREDPTLRAEIESLLTDDAPGGPFLEEPAFAVAARLVAGDIPGLAGHAFGPYRIDGLLGAGGMGDVYRAHDTILGRDVAIKVLPEAFSDDAERLARFKQEAQFLASLSHPNIAAIYGVHEADGLRGLVLELVDGETLAQRIERGPIPLYDAARIARQIGEGLDAAHQRGIVHRDLKPSNIKIASDGTTKILDFGLAKSAAADGFGAGGSRESSAGSDGLVLGTASYMSPEQARGDVVDKRTDIWAFGCVCFEMLTGQPAFRRNTPDGQQDAAVPRWDLMPRPTPGGVTTLLKRCLDEDPRRRRRDVGDVLGDLDDALRDDGRAAEKPGRGWRPWRAAMLGLAAVLTAFVTGWAVRGRGVVERELPVWRKLTFNDGMVHTARFGPDGQTILYSASWDGKPFQVFSTTTLRPESRALDLPPAGLLGVSRSGQLALALSCAYVAGQGGCRGTLARAPLLGGAPRVLAEDVHAADWGPNDTLAAVVSNRLEFPLGNALADRAGQVRVSPDGGRLAWADRIGDNSWVVAVRSGQTRHVVSQGWTFVSGLAWASDGTALFVSGMSPGNHDDGVSRIEMDGTTRTVLRSRPRVRVLDAAPDDRLLIDHSESVTRAWVHDANAAGGRRDLTWLGSSVVDAISHDGRNVLLTVRTGATLEGGRSLSTADLYPIYVRPTDGGPAALLGNGYGHALSDDGRWALTSTRGNRDSKVVLYPLGPGPARTLDNAGLDMRPLANPATNVSFAGSSRIAVFVARRDDGPLLTYVQAIDGGPPASVEHEPGYIVSPMAPDGERFVSQRPDGSLWLATLGPGAAVRLPFTLQPNQFIRQWSLNGRQVFIFTVRSDRWEVTRVDLKTGSVEPHREVMRDPLEDPMFASSVRISRDGAVIAGTGNRTVSSLFLIEGVR